MTKRIIQKFVILTFELQSNEVDLNKKCSKNEALNKSKLLYLIYFNLIHFNSF